MVLVVLVVVLWRPARGQAGCHIWEEIIINTAPFKAGVAMHVQQTLDSLGSA